MKRLAVLGLLALAGCASVSPSFGGSVGVDQTGRPLALGGAGVSWSVFTVQAGVDHHRQPYAFAGVEWWWSK